MKIGKIVKGMALRLGVAAGLLVGGDLTLHYLPEKSNWKYYESDCKSESSCGSGALSFALYEAKAAHPKDMSYTIFTDVYRNRMGVYDATRHLLSHFDGISGKFSDGNSAKRIMFPSELKSIVKEMGLIVYELKGNEKEKIRRMNELVKEDKGVLIRQRPRGGILNNLKQHWVYVGKDTPRYDYNDAREILEIIVIKG